jgi:hypothetical protein
MRNSILRALVASDLLEEVFQGSWLKYLAWRFRSQRADYYQYLADLIDGTGGTKTLFSIFQDDAQRMRKRNCRGALSQVWLERYPLVGGDLFATWFGSIPLEDLIAIQNAQSTGAQALVSTLRKLSEMCRLLDRAKSMFVQTALVGFVALLVAIGALMSIPIYTAEHLARVFSAVPVELYGQWTNALQLCATWLRALWLLALLVLLGMVLGVVWSLPNGVGVANSTILGSGCYIDDCTAYGSCLCLESFLIDAAVQEPVYGMRSHCRRGM